MASPNGTRGLAVSNPPPRRLLCGTCCGRPRLANACAHRRRNLQFQVVARLRAFGPPGTPQSTAFGCHGSFSNQNYTDNHRLHEGGDLDVCAQLLKEQNNKTTKSMLRWSARITTLPHGVLPRKEIRIRAAREVPLLGSGHGTPARGRASTECTKSPPPPRGFRLERKYASTQCAIVGRNSIQRAECSSHSG